MQAATIRPGFLISLKTSVSGNISYQRQDIEAEHFTADGAVCAKWQTEKTISDPAEFGEATKVRSKARSLISAVCSVSAFGLLCPETRTADFDAAVEQAQALADAFNATAKLTRVSVYVLAGRIAADDVQAMRAINSEIRDLLADMEAGLKGMNAQQVRDAASKARAMGQMLSPDAASRVKSAVEAARSAARQIVKAGEGVAIEIDRVALAAIAKSRTAFLDLDASGEEIQAPTVTGRAIDFDTAPTPIAAAAPSQPAWEF